MDSDDSAVGGKSEDFRAEKQQFLADVNFGVGRIWREDLASEKASRSFLYEFFGSLLTGILVSIGAPYWNDLLRALSGLRATKAAKS